MPSSIDHKVSPPCLHIHITSGIVFSVCTRSPQMKQNTFNLSYLKSTHIHSPPAFFSRMRRLRGFRTSMRLLFAYNFSILPRDCYHPSLERCQYNCQYFVVFSQIESQLEGYKSGSKRKCEKEEHAVVDHFPPTFSQSKSANQRSMVLNSSLC